MGFSAVEEKKLPPIDENEFEIKKPNIFGVRHFQAILIFLGMVTTYFLRTNISIAIVPMTQPQDNAPHYDWESGTKSIILSSFFWGYTVMQIPAGILVRRYGHKIIYSLAMLSGGVLTVLCPLAASVGNWQLLVTTRIIAGFTQSFVFVCTHTMLSKWAPRTERSFLGTTIYSGAQLGAVIILAGSGSIISSMGWPSLFYLSGAISILWGFIFLIYGCNQPSQSKVITKEEKDYIEALTGVSNTNVPANVPFRSILTSAPFYALAASQCSLSWGSYTLLTEIPTYLSQALNLDIQSNSLLSALPYLCMWLFSFIVSPISDMLINRRILRVEVSRKLFNTVGQWVPMISLIGLGYVTSENQALAMALLTVSVSFNVACFCGYLVNHIDLSPNFAGSMMSISNMLASICSIIAPLIVGLVVKDESDASQWRIVFFISAGIYLFGNGIFLIFGKASIQPWNSVSSENSKNVGNVNIST